MLVHYVDTSAWRVACDELEHPAVPLERSWTFVLDHVTCPRCLAVALGAARQGASQRHDEKANAPIAA